MYPNQWNNTSPFFRGDQQTFLDQLINKRWMEWEETTLTIWIFFSEKWTTFNFLCSFRTTLAGEEPEPERYGKSCSTQ